MDRSIPSRTDREPSDAGRVIDPVCGMTVDQAVARSKGLTFSHGGTEYGFCGRGCRLDFEDDPDRYLAPGYVPAM